MPRPYALRARADGALNTRQRILEAAIALLAEDPHPTVNVLAIAEQCGVARSTIYSAFGSRGGLIAAMFKQVFDRSGSERLGELFSLPDASQALRRSLEQGCLMYARDRDVVARLILVSDLDAEAAEAAAADGRKRAAGMRDLAHRLADQGHLRDGMSEEEAAAYLWVVTSFWTFDQLYTGWRLSARRCGRAVVEMATRTLLRPERL
jgi:AcrR family transcriptional regulator